MFLRIYKDEFVLTLHKTSHGKSSVVKVEEDLTNTGTVKKWKTIGEVFVVETHELNMPWTQ